MLETLCRHLDMVRLSAAGVLMISLMGCVGLIDGGSDGLTAQQKEARAKWVDSALPVFRTNCMSCHNGSRPNVGFLVGDEDFAIRNTLINFDPPVVDLDAASSSRVLTKGLHDGPQLTAEQSSALLLWLQAERQSASHDPDHPVIQLATKPVALQLCTKTLAMPDNPCPINHISLDGVADGVAVPGAELTFNATALQSGTYFTNLTVNGGTAGVYMEHVLFVSLQAGADATKPASPFPDQIDRYFALKLNVAGGKTSLLGGGTEAFAGFTTNANDMLEIHFKKLGAYQPDTTPPLANGCKVLAGFKANAVPQMNANCASCHTGTANAGAKGAMDITGLAAADDATALTACNQVRSRLNLTNTDQSGFYLAPDPSSATAHPFKFNNVQANFNAFKTAMDVWVKAEQTAP